MSARSETLFAAAPGAGVDTTAFTCPAGHVAIVKTVYATELGAANTTGTVYITRPSVPAYVYLSYGNIAQFQTLRFDGWVVLSPGDEIHVVSTAVGCHFWGSGALLSAI